jgi:hypothetical protein
MLAATLRLLTVALPEIASTHHFDGYALIKQLAKFDVGLTLQTLRIH